MYYFIFNNFYLLIFVSYTILLGTIFRTELVNLYLPFITALCPTYKYIVYTGWGGGGRRSNTTVSDVTSRLGGGGGRDGNADRLATTYTDGYELTGGGRGGGRGIIDIRWYINWW
jgi:hypothetical protein